MCPSYRATLDEQHSTRGRAHLLHEMMRGEVVRGGWRDERVKESLDLCLACKACKTECPVKVDMASYKAEFLSQYYKHKRRPLSAYLFGRIDLWARLAQIWPTFFNFFMQAPVFKQIMAVFSGMTLKREFPVFASQSFRKWFSARGGRGHVSGPQGNKEVILWPDTFNNYFHPQTAQKAVQVLEALGYRVQIPARNFCCGRPLYDFGMLDTAKRYLFKIMEGLKKDLEKNTPIVCLEPGCASVFKDELLNLFPGNETAKKLSGRVFLLAEFLEKDASALALLKQKDFSGVLHGHCHQKSLAGLTSEEKIFKAMGLDVKILDTGCCGMAGAFGFEKDHYEVSMKTAETSLTPALAQHREKTVMTDGFSCREQIRHISGKKTPHLAEVLAEVLNLSEEKR